MMAGAGDDTNVERLRAGGLRSSREIIYFR